MTHASSAVSIRALSRENYKKETGKVLGEVARAKDVGQRMLEAFPAPKEGL
jgi:hypothetical protein